MRKTALKWLMDDYAQRQGGTRDAYRFIFDGNRIVETCTPDDLEMEDDDVIDAMLEQVWHQQDVHKYGLGLPILNLAHSRQQ